MDIAMGRDTIGVLDDKVVGGKGYRINWATDTLIPLEEWTEYYIQTPTFKLWGIDARLKIDITQEQSDRKQVSMVIRLSPLDPQSQAWANFCESTESFLSAFYNEYTTFDSRKGKGDISIPSPNIFQLNFKLSLNKKTGAPQMRGDFDIKWVVEKPRREYSLEVAKTSLDRLHGFQHLSNQLGRLLENPENSDLTIRCGNQEFPVHKFILSARSTTLKEMIGELEEDTLEIDKVKGRSIGPGVVNVVLEWIYTDQLDEEIEDEEIFLDKISDLAEIWGLEKLQNYVDTLVHFINRLENSESDEEIETPPKKKSKTGKKNQVYNLVLGDLEVIPWKSRRMEWTVQIPKLREEVKKLQSPSVRFFGEDWNLLLKVSYKTKMIHAFKTVFQISLQSEPGTLLDYGFEFGAEPKFIYDVKYNDPGFKGHDYWRFSGSDFYDESDYAGSDEDECFWNECFISKSDRFRHGIKRVGNHAYKFTKDSSVVNRLYEKGHEIKIDWTLQIDFDDWSTAEKMKKKIKRGIEFLDDLSLDLGSLLNDPGEGDVVLRCEGKDFRAHKVILGAQSSVFKVMLETPMKESLESVIEIKDVHGELVGQDVFGAILHWMYSGELGELDQGQILITLGMANFYNLSKLKELCEVKLKALISEDSVVDILIMADFVGAEGLKGEAMQFIHKNKSITKKKEFKEKVGWDLFQDIFTWLDN